MDGLHTLGAQDVIGRMDLGKHPAYDSIKPYNPGDIVSYGGEVWRCLQPVYPVAFGRSKGAKATADVTEWIAKGDGIVHAPSNSDSHWENISDKNESDFIVATPSISSTSAVSYAQTPTTGNSGLGRFEGVFIGAGAVLVGTIIALIAGRK